MDGYHYIYVSNERPLDVFFDNVTVQHHRGPLLGEDHYYPFGLAMSGINAQAAGKLENLRKYNKGSELQHKEFSDSSGLELYATEFRSLDSQLGRWLLVDPKPDMSMSLYSSMGDNPVLYNDYLGDSVGLGSLYDKDDKGNYKNVNEIIVFKLFASTKDGKKYLLNHAQKGFSLQGAYVMGLDIKADKEGALSKKGVDISLNVVKNIPNADAKTDDSKVDGRLKISFSIKKSDFDSPFSDNQNWRDGMLNKVDGYAHEFFLHGDLLENFFK